MPGRAEKESGIITPKLDAPERRAPPGPLQPPCRTTPLSATPQGHKQSHPVTAPSPSRVQQQLTLASEQSPLANSFGVSHLAPATSPLAHHGYFRCSLPAGGRPRFAQGSWTPPGTMPRRRARRPVRLVLIPPAAAELPGRAAHARPTSWGPDVRQRLTQTSPAMCTQPRPGKNPPPR